MGEGRVYDLLLRCRSNRPDPRVVVVVGIDDATFTALGGRMPTRDEEGPAIARVGPPGCRPDRAGPLLRTRATRRRTPRWKPRSPRPIRSWRAAQLGTPARRALWKKAVGVGSIDLLTDSDGVLRRLPPPFLQPTKGGLGDLRSPFALEIARQIRFPGGALPRGRRALPSGSASTRIPWTARLAHPLLWRRGYTSPPVLCRCYRYGQAFARPQG